MAKHIQDTDHSAILKRENLTLHVMYAKKQMSLNGPARPCARAVCGQPRRTHTRAGRSARSGRPRLARPGPGIVEKPTPTEPGLRPHGAIPALHSRRDRPAPVSHLFWCVVALCGAECVSAVTPQGRPDSRKSGARPWAAGKRPGAPVEPGGLGRLGRLSRGPRRVTALF